MRRLIVIANCHSLSLARALSLGAVGVDVGFVDLNFIGRENELERFEELRAGLAADSLVVSFVCSHRQKPFATDELRALLGCRLLTFTNVRFDGLHPDMTYVGPSSNRKHSAMGVYHSKLALYGYAMGYSARDCARLFHPLHYEKLGYFQTFEDSAQLLQQRDLPCDIKCASKFLSMTRRQHTLYTFNHLTGSVFQAIAAEICDAADIRFLNFSQEFSINELSTGQIWPVYNDIAEFHQLPYRTPQSFIQQQSFSSRSMSLTQMIMSSFEVYDRHYNETLKDTVRDQKFFELFRDKIG